MKMFADLCIDAFDENREKTWQGVFEKMEKDPYWLEKYPPPPKVEEPAPVPVKKAKKKRPLKKKKAPAVVLPLEERLFFNKAGGAYETGGTLNDHQIIHGPNVT